MDSSTLDKTLQRMEREILSLKTAQARGLGAMNFYRYTASIDMPSSFTSPYVKIKATVANGENFPPFIQLGGDPANALQFPTAFTISGRVYIWTITSAVYTGLGKTLYLEVVSSSKLSSFTAELSDVE